jgi:flagellar protein FliO/FliZ
MVAVVLSVIRPLIWSGVLLGVFFSNHLYAETGASLSPNPNFWGLGGQVLLVLTLVIALLFFLTWFLKRSGLAQQAANGHLKVLGGVSVGQRERVLLLQVGQDQILVGVTATEITLLHMLSQPIDIDEGERTSVSFSQQLQGLIRRREESS